MTAPTDIAPPQESPAGSGSDHRLVVHLDLFSGIGGFALAAQMVGGIKTVGFCEIEPYACKVLAKNFPNIPNHGDIRNIRNVKADLVTGGFPCQPYSVAGQRGGSGDDRALWPHMLRVIEASKPRWVLGENVPGIVSMELDRVLSDLEGVGYAAWPIIVPACAVDAKHRRERVWIVAHSDSGPGLGWQYQPGRKEKGRAAAWGDGETLSDTDSPRGQKLPRQKRGWAGPGESCRCGVQGNRPAEWITEPDVGRVANGVSARMDRLRGLGNAIVPQVAAEILRCMMHVDSLHNVEPIHGEKDA